jgi:hypothetical protein
VEDPTRRWRPPVGASKHQSDRVRWIEVNPVGNRPGSLIFMWCLILCGWRKCHLRWGQKSG